MKMKDITDVGYETWLWEKLGNQCVSNLSKHGFDAHYVNDVNDAGKLITGLVEKYGSFGFGGSVTTRALGLNERLRKMGKTVHDHWDPDSGMGDLEIRLAQGRCDCFLCSANAVSLTGEIINVDGVGNRNNAMAFGCPKVVIVAGMNKVAKDLPSALDRIREIAAPMRAKSLGLKTPCAETGICIDCNSPQRICNITTILHRKPMMTDVSVVLVNERMGY